MPSVLSVVLWVGAARSEPSPPADTGPAGFAGQNIYHPGILWSEEAYALHPDERTDPSEPSPFRWVKPYVTFDAEGAVPFGSIDTCRRASVVRRYGHDILRTTHHRDAQGRCVEAPWLFDLPITLPPLDEGEVDHGGTEVREACEGVFGRPCDVRFDGRIDLTGVRTLGELCARVDEIPRAPGLGIACSIKQARHGPWLVLWVSSPRPPMPTPEQIQAGMEQGAAMHALMKRYARREIDVEEFARERDRLLGLPPSTEPVHPGEPAPPDAD